MISKQFIVALGCLAAAWPCAGDALEGTAINSDMVAFNDTDFDSDYQSEYKVSISGVTLTDVDTKTPDIVTIHNNNPFEVIANLKWEEQIYDAGSSNVLNWFMLVDGAVEGQGSVDLQDSRALPSQIEAGTASVDKSGTHSISVKITLDALTDESNNDYESFAAGASFVPLVIVVLAAATTQMVELSLGLGIFVGSCMVAGTLVGGFRNMLNVYLINSLANKDHAYVFLFILFMSGLVGLIEKAGGLQGIANGIKKYVKTSRSAQGASLCAGLLIFFDDYANTLVAGASMRPLTDACIVSREKLAFIVDATAAPIASLVPISSWVGFEISLIQPELDKILMQDPSPDIVKTAFGVFLETIKYRYYCIFLLLFMPILIASGRDFGPMLIAERLTKVYGRTDGGPGAAVAADGQIIKSHNAPESDTPCRWWNMAFPILALVGYIFYLLVHTGQQAGGQGFVESIENSNSYEALLWGTMAAALTALAFYFIQDKKEGRIIFFNGKGYLNKIRRFVDRRRGGKRSRHIQEEDKDEDEDDEFRESGADKTMDEEEEEHAKILIDHREAMSSFLIGMEKIFGALVVLTLAWATGAIMKAVGLDRVFGEILTNPALDYRMLPTLSFITAVLIGFATGTSWGTMSIMFPLILVPSYNASGGEPTIFYGVTAGILSGAVAGDHASPISDTTILSAMATDCQLLQHVKTQAPYAFMVTVWSVLVGTIPSGMGSFGNWVSILLGFLAMAFHVFFTSELPINKSGRYDIFTELYIRCAKNTDFLTKLREDTALAFESGEPVPLHHVDNKLGAGIMGEKDEFLENNEGSDGEEREDENQETKKREEDNVEGKGDDGDMEGEGGEEK